MANVREIDVNSHQLCRISVLGNRLHGTARFCLFYKEGKSHHDDDTCKDGYDGDSLDGKLTVKQCDGRNFDNSYETLGICAEDQKCQVLKQITDTDSRDKNGQV